MERSFGPYRQLEELGAGGMGVVYSAVQETLGRPVALKLLPECPDQVDFLPRFKREMRLAATVNHPNLVQVYDGGVIDGTPYIAMERISGESLDRRLTAQGALPWREATSLAIGTPVGGGILIASPGTRRLSAPLQSWR